MKPEKPNQTFYTIADINRAVGGSHKMAKYAYKKFRRKGENTQRLQKGKHIRMTKEEFDDACAYVAANKQAPKGRHAATPNKNIVQVVDNSQQYSFMPFTFKDHQVRSLHFRNSPWFVAIDICSALDLRNPRQVVSALDADEKCSIDLTVHSTDGQPFEQLSPHHRNGLLNIVNISGMFALIFQSRKQEAVAFRKWVTSDVLPSIFATGSYSVHQQDQFTVIMDRIKTIEERLAKIEPGTLLPATVDNHTELIPMNTVKARLAREELVDNINEITRLLKDQNHKSLYNLVYDFEHSINPDKPHLKRETKRRGKETIISIAERTNRIMPCLQYSRRLLDDARKLKNMTGTDTTSQPSS